MNLFHRFFSNAFRLCVPIAMAASCASVSAAPPPKPAFQVGQSLPAQSAKQQSEYREIKWRDLIPAGWRPDAAFKGLDISKLQDNDPRAMDALAQMRESWNNAPVEPSMKNARVRIAGFVIPLERVKDEVKEFLLVPYFGACIHVPPPPPNQIIYVVSEKPLKNVMTMDPMWVSGTMTLSATDSDWGRAAYQLKAKDVAPFPLPTGK